MQHLIIYFEHDIKDIIPWSMFIERLRHELAETGVGEFESDDMAIDGSDCEAIFRSTDVEQLLRVLLPHFRRLSFLRNPTTTVELVFGEMDSSSKRQTFGIEPLATDTQELT